MSEDQIHYAVVDYLRLRNCLFFHVPNQRMCTLSYRRKLKKLGLLAGVADLVIIKPDGKILFLEIKIV